jgi:CBS domain-containing protein
MRAKAEDLMKDRILVVSRSMPTDEILRIRQERRIEHVVIVDEDGWPVGVISGSDLLRYQVTCSQVSTPSS